MKAAVLHSFGSPPQFEEFPDPTAGPGEVVLRVKASAITRLARTTALGLHYTSARALPAVVGPDGVGLLPDGRRVYATDCRPPYGMMAERTVVPRDRCAPVPEGVDDLAAATLPNAALSSWLALAYRAKLARGETVLILGATGVAGKLAIAVARHLGAGRVVAAGRDETVLRTLPRLGADAIVSLRHSDAELSEALARAADGRRFDVVLDYLWGHPAEVVLTVMTGRGSAGVVPRTRFVTVGAMAGPTAAVPSAAFRSSGLELLGSGIGSVPTSATVETLPKMWALALRGGLPVGTEKVPLADVASAWNRPETDGRRLVLVP